MVELIPLSSGKEYLWKTLGIYSKAVKRTQTFKYKVDLNPKEIEEFSLYDIAGIILEVEENAKETSCASCQ